MQVDITCGTTKAMGTAVARRFTFLEQNSVFMILRGQQKTDHLVNITYVSSTQRVIE